MKRLLSLLLALAMIFALAACGGGNDNAVTPAEGTPADTAGDAADEPADEPADAEGTEDWHIGIVTGSVSQSEDDRRGAEAFQAAYGEDKVTLAIYPDNFTEELETTIQTIVNMSDDPLMKAIIVNQSIPGTTEAFRQIKDRR